MMQIAARDFGERRPEHLVEKMRAARDFPGVEDRGELLATIPKVVRLLLDLARGDGVRRDREGALRLDGPRELERVRVSRDVIRDADSQNVGGSRVGKGVFRELKSGENDHLIELPSAFSFRFEDLLIEREDCGSKSAAEDLSRFAKKGALLAEMIGDGDRPEAAATVQIDELGDGELPVAEGRVNVQVSDKHII